MKALLYLYELNHGGHSITAIELAAGLRDQCGWDVVLFGSPGAMVDLAEERGLRFLPGPPGGMGISPRDTRALWSACRSERPDLVHAWDWRPIFTAFHGAYLGRGIPLLGSVTAMFPPTILPPHVPITFVTEEVRRRDPRRHAENFVLDPAINTDLDDPARIDTESFRAAHGLDVATVHVVIVSRLAAVMKLESILRTIDAVGELARDHPVDLVIVGDGDAAADVTAAADAVNVRLGRPVVKMLGAMVDPRPAYAAADIVAGMGTSAARWMAFGKPVVIVGERGFSETFTPATVDELVDAGFYGVGAESVAAPLRAQLEELVVDRTRRQRLGSFSRAEIACFGVESVARSLGAIYESVVAEPVHRGPMRVSGALLRAGALVGGYGVKWLVPASVRHRFWHRHDIAPSARTTNVAA